MRYFILICLFSFAAISCNQSNKSEKTQKDSIIQKTDSVSIKTVEMPPPPTPSPDTSGKQTNPVSHELDFLREMNGKYPYAVKLFEKTAFTDRLKKLLGDRYTFLKSTWAVENPIEVKNNVFVAWGCEQHNCSSTNFMVVVDLAKNKMYAGIREEEKVKTYSEDGTESQDIQKWATGQ